MSLHKLKIRGLVFQGGASSTRKITEKGRDGRVDVLHGASFDLISRPGFRRFCQLLLDQGAQNSGQKMDIDDLLPDESTVRQVYLRQKFDRSKENRRLSWRALPLRQSLPIFGPVRISEKSGD